MKIIIGYQTWVNVDYFFDDTEADDKGFFTDEPEALGLARDLYYQNNRI